MHCNTFDITSAEVSIHYNEHLKFEICHHAYNFITRFIILTISHKTIISYYNMQIQAMFYASILLISYKLR